MAKILLLILIISFSSCQFVVKTLYGIKKPKPEDRNSVNHYLVKIKSDSTNSLFVKAAHYGDIYRMINSHVPEVLIFDKNGYLINYRPEGTTCNNYVNSFLDSFSISKKYLVPDSLKTLSVVSGMLENDQILFANIKNYTALIFWFKPLGRLNKQYVTEWGNKALQKGFTVYKVNMDLQKTWSQP